MEGFRQFLLNQKGMYVQLERGGPDACAGWIESVAADYVTLRCDEAIRIHLPLQHVRSVTPLQPFETRPSEPVPPDTYPETFAELLLSETGRWVRLYHSGPELSVGVLREATSDYLMLEVEPGATACFARFHVRSVCVLPDALLVSAERDARDTPEKW